MKESCCVFGEHQELAGIVTQGDDDDGSQAPKRTALVLINAGLVPKFGPFRLYAELARRLAQHGFVTLRFDLGGIGDSRNDHGNLALKQRTELEIRAALLYVFGRGDVDAVVLGGLCSGAEDAFRAAEHDARVKGVLMIDPFAYRTKGFYPRYFLHRAARRVRRALGLFTPNPRFHAEAPKASSWGKTALGETQAASLVNYKYMDSTESSRILKTLVARRSHVHFVYTGGAVEVFNHTGQLGAMFPGIEFGDRVTLDHLPDLDHTQLLEEHRRRMVDAIARRLLAAHGESRLTSPASQKKPRPEGTSAWGHPHRRLRALISR